MGVQIGYHSFGKDKPKSINHEKTYFISISIYCTNFIQL